MRAPVPQVLALLGCFSAVLLAGNAGLRLPVPYPLQIVELLLAVGGVLWAGHRGAGVLAALGLSTWTTRGALLAVLGTLPMAVGLAAPDGSAAELLDTLLVGSLLAPLGEELLFRGYAVSGLLDGGWPRGRAIVATGLLFGLLHVPGALSSGVGPAVSTGLVTALGGVWYGWLYLRWQRSLWVPLLAHMAMNTWWTLGDMGPTAGSGGALATATRALAITIVTVLTLRWTKPPRSALRERVRPRNRR